MKFYAMNSGHKFQAVFNILKVSKAFPDTVFTDIHHLSCYCRCHGIVNVVFSV